MALTTPPGTTARPLRSPRLARRIHAAVPADRALNPLAHAFLDLLVDVSRDFDRP